MADSGGNIFPWDWLMICDILHGFFLLLHKEIRSGNRRNDRRSM
jgi:hypothetical protein